MEVRSYLEESLSFIESREMRDYLRVELPKFKSISMFCADIVAYAPAPIERKLPVLEQIIREAEPLLAFDREPYTICASRFAHSCRTALAERYSGPEGSIFWMKASSYDDDGSCLFDNEFFTKFDAAIRYLEQLAEENPDDCAFEGLNYTITKYIPDGRDGLREHCTWYLNNTRELWYFECEHSRSDFQEGWRDLFDYLGDGPNLPVPFQPGDIVVADCLPYAEPCRVLILDIGDNRDCCCISHLSIDKDGFLCTGAFKHNHFLSHKGVSSRVSGLYRAARWTGELTDEEKPFAVLSPLIRTKPELGKEINDFVGRKGNSKSWSEVKEAFL